MSPRPKIHIEESKTVKRQNRLAFFLVLLHFIIIGGIYSLLPYNIPTHFNLAGQIDSEGPKGMIWIIPFLSLAIYYLLKLLNKYPQHHNYTVKITEENAEYQYKKSMAFGAYLNLLIASFFLLLTTVVILSSIYPGKNFGTLLVIALVLFIILILKKAFSK